MRTINISQDIVPVGEFKTGISKWLRTIRDRNHPIVITQNGRPAGVLITPEEYDKLVYNKTFTESINRGIQDIKSGNIFTTSELKNKIRESRKSRI
ncbi:MAG: type II toxin-antitoxin system Phd/YefM family antitoxin [Candidatus Marinimicrobia bacterium]|nr:type II toxin-antitoxin system Phd/YefM family antitoxin [bacterium]MCG2716012.1 type II toxin-antitoxin system Phd/YefM family antitoxin [Candidatus Neomarinimicrobiota bacterium]